MASNFTKFLLSLSEDPQKLEALKQDLNAALDAAHLTPAEKALIKSGNAQLIRSALLADPGFKETLGIDASQTIPSMTMCIFIVIDQEQPTITSTDSSTDDSDDQDSTDDGQGA